MRVSSINDVIPSYRPFAGHAVEFAEVASDYLKRDHRDHKIYRTVFPSWDNTARVQDRALIVLGATVGNYERWLKGATSLTESERSGDGQLVFINAWNEWAEGCHLEPDREFGHGFLEATLRVKNGVSTVDDIYDSHPLRRPSSDIAGPFGLSLKWKVAARLHDRPLALWIARLVYRIFIGIARCSSRLRR